MMAWAKVKVVAGVLTGLAFASGGAIVLTGQVASSAPQPSQPATTAMAHSEAGHLEFRIAIQRGQPEPAVSSNEANSLIRQLARQGPDAIRTQRTDMAWFPIDDRLADKPEWLPITGEFAGRSYVLASTLPEHTMLSGQGGDQAWSLTRLYTRSDELNRPAVGFDFDPAGARQFGDLTASHLKRLLLCLIDTQVVSAATIQSRISGSGILSSEKMTRDQAQAIVTRLQPGLSPSTTPATRPSVWEGFASEQELTVPCVSGPRSTYIDLDKGTTLQPPADAEEWTDPRQSTAWIRKSGADAIASNNGFFRGLLGYDLAALPIGESLPQINWQASLPLSLEQATPATPAMLSAAGKLPVYYAFRTREGSMGILWITELTTGPATIHLHYRLLR